MSNVTRVDTYNLKLAGNGFYSLPWCVVKLAIVIEVNLFSSSVEDHRMRQCSSSFNNNRHYE